MVQQIVLVAVDGLCQTSNPTDAGGWLARGVIQMRFDCHQTGRYRPCLYIQSVYYYILNSFYNYTIQELLISSGI